jgi:biotin transport system substrate-specific component
MEIDEITGKSAIGLRAVAKDFSLPILCALAILSASVLRVPFYPVPFTMQTFAVVAVSIFAGRRRAWAGLSLFTVLWWPFTVAGGYVLGFFAAPLVLGTHAAKLGPRALLLRIFSAHFAILAIGTAVLSATIGVRAAIIGGFVFFIPAEILKGLLSFTAVRIAAKFSIG